ncbi:teneurin-2- hypothetical protein [Limosa lapponica baueri]|uniref:Teneurin N-terminal domain-containing protein n=1 Tax=Limosa lapponica baueri TaxID=1758121 RepID=A0A2I0TVD0_LIMLA|nr:teneurin-2- hypothetical protein [Limosa lapponica baueri]
MGMEAGTNFTLAELGICEPSPHRSGYCSDIGILHQGYSLSTGSDADSDTEGGMSPEHAIRLWGRGIKSRRSSGLSSRENSALTLTDSDNENKSDEENGRLQFELVEVVLKEFIASGLGLKMHLERFIAEENPSVAIKHETPLLAQAVPELQIA